MTLLFTDENVGQNSKVYNRIKWIDADGKYYYSNIIKLNSSRNSQIEIFPNLAKNTITVNGMKGSGEIRIVNFEGKNLLLQKVSSESQLIDISLLPKGAYILQYKNDKDIHRQKFIKL